MPKIKHFWAKTCWVYRYQLSGTGKGMQWAIDTGTGQSGTDTTTSSSPVFAYFALLSPVFVYQLFRDPKKLLMGVQIRMRLSEKRTVPRRRGEASMIICLNTKSEEFVFD